jgi:branched-chain amino acid transport system substrate-binding protein
MTKPTSAFNYLKHRFDRTALVIGVATALMSPSIAVAQKKYDQGATDKEIKIGQTMPYSGPASSYAVLGRVMGAYFAMINEQGGINGRKVTFLSYDDGFSPSKTVEQTRKLVESDEVLAIAGSLGSPTSLSVANYLNARKIPQILVFSATPKLDDPSNLPWTTTFYSSAIVETQIYSQYILQNKPEGKIAVLYQGDDYGRGYLDSLKAALGDKASMIIATASYNITDPTIDSQLVSLKASGADVLLIAATPKFAAQAIRKAHELKWVPMRIIITAAASVELTLKQAGLDASDGLITSLWQKDPTDPEWKNDPAMKGLAAFIDKYLPGTRWDDDAVTMGYSSAQTLHEILRRCGDDLTRANLIKQATSIKDFQLPLFVPGVKLNVSSTSRIAWRSAQIARFDGAHFVRLGDIITVSEGKMRY